MLLFLVFVDQIFFIELKEYLSRGEDFFHSPMSRGIYNGPQTMHRQRPAVSSWTMRQEVENSPAVKH